MAGKGSASLILRTPFRVLKCWGGSKEGFSLAPYASCVVLVVEQGSACGLRCRPKKSKNDEEVSLKTGHWLCVSVSEVSADLPHAGFLWRCVYPCLSYIHTYPSFQWIDLVAYQRTCNVALRACCITVIVLLHLFTRH